MPISSYLLLIGLYYSARSIAGDKEILVSLKNRVKEDPSAFLSGIGSAEWSKNVESTVESLVKRTEKPINETDSELSSQDVQKYLAEVIEEIQRRNRKSSYSCLCCRSKRFVFSFENVLEAGVVIRIVKSEKQLLERDITSRQDFSIRSIEIA